MGRHRLSAIRITVCIVVFNGYPQVLDAVESVAQQKYPNVELVIVDGGSTDGTLDALKGLSSGISTLVSEPDRGIYDAMNKALSIARGDWLVFLGSDDRLLDSLEEVATRLRDANTVYYGNVIIRSTGSAYGGRFSKYRLMQANICHQAIFYPRALYRTNSYSLQYRFLADYEYNLRLIGLGKKFKYMPVNVTIFNNAGASMLGDVDFERDRMRLIRENLGLTWAILKRVRTIAVKIFRLTSSRTA